MVTSFDTSVSAPAASQSKGGNTLLILIGIAVLGFLGYKYLIKQELDKEKERAAK